MNSKSILSCFGVSVGLLAVACSAEVNSSNAELATAGAGPTAGGINGSGGATSAGGAASGGASSSNGGTSTSSGTALVGGNSGIGGATSSGGTTTGDSTGAGGSATGGATNVGGAATGGKATGGAANVGGAATGGKATGGATSAATGGKATGGATGVGGAATGGATGTGGAASDCANFSFFVTSLVAIRRESANTDGFGGDLGGLSGADAICQRIAEASLTCAGQKTWRAFLSTSSVNAITRIGDGPWYDRNGRTVALTTADLLNTRPRNADAAIANDLPNEDGVPNHSPDGTIVDNHDTLTGSNSQGTLYAANATCSDWTSTTASGSPRVGHSWPGGPSQHWMNAMSAPGCARGINTSSQGNGNCANSSGTTVAGVGCAGGYGGFYCFATTP